MASILGSINDFLTSFFIVLLLLVFFYGQNFQGWLAGRQLKSALKKLEKMKHFGVELINSAVDPFRSETLTDNDIAKFIDDMLKFFVIPPSDIDPPMFEKLHYLEGKREERFQTLIQKFLPAIDNKSLARITALLNTTSEIDNLYRKVRHNLIVGEKTKSYWFLLQKASEITQTMLKAQAYQIALTTFMKNYPIGDSIGPLVLYKFVHEQAKASQNPPKHEEVYNNIFKQEINYLGRKCICLRAKGPDIHVGRPGMAAKIIFEQYRQQNKNFSLVLTVDAISRLEGEPAGSIAHGLGVALGSGQAKNLEKYQIEELALKQTPSVPLEAIVCKESFEEAVSPMIEPIKNAVPKVVRKLKQIIRSQTKKGDNILIIGIGNAIGVPL